MTEKEIVRALKEQRTKLELTQRELAEFLDIPQSTIYRVEGFVTSPLLSTVIRYADTVGMRLYCVETKLLQQRLDVLKKA